MEKKILFLKARTGMDDPSPPMAFSFLGSIAEKNGYKVLVENLNAQYNTKTNKDIIELIKKEKPSIVGVHIFTNAARYSYELIKEIQPYCELLIAGGPHATACPEEVLERGADIAFIGEAEISFDKFLNSLNSKKSFKKIKGLAYKDNKKIVNNGNAEIVYNLDSIPFPDKKINRKEDYIKIRNEKNNFGQILSTRGCPGKCTYCFTLFEKCFRVMSAKKVFEEILYLQKEYNVDFINFIDDSFTINKKRLMELCDLFIESKIPVKWSCGTRVDFLDREMIKKMKEAGCELIVLGIETAIPKTLLGMNKVIGANGITTPEEYTKRADDILEWCREFKVRVGTNILCGFPWETAKDMKEMQKYINKIKYKITQGFYGGILQPQPGTIMYDKYAKEYGFEKWWINKKPLFKDDYRPLFMTHYHQYWDHLHNNFFNFNKELFREIDKLYRLMGKWNLYIFARRRFKNNSIAYLIYQNSLLVSRFSEFLYFLSPALEKKLMERIKKFSYRLKFRKGSDELN
jgi:anaerobic magnesium-protoporphyrin IX monomethyl ester cyclase